MKQNPQMITGSWDDITLVCGNTHDEPVNMVLQEGPSSLFYACPKDRKGTLYKVLKHDGNQLTISVYNKKAVNTYPQYGGKSPGTYAPGPCFSYIASPTPSRTDIKLAYEASPAAP